MSKWIKGTGIRDSTFKEYDLYINLDQVCFIVPRFNSARPPVLKWWLVISKEGLTRLASPDTGKAILKALGIEE